MQNGNPTSSAHRPEAQTTPAPDVRTPGDGERVEPVEARSARRVGLWKMLAVSLAMAIAGIALVSALSG